MVGTAGTFCAGTTTAAVRVTVTSTVTASVGRSVVEQWGSRYAPMRTRAGAKGRVCGRGPSPGVPDSVPRSAYPPCKLSSYDRSDDVPDRTDGKSTMTSGMPVDSAACIDEVVPVSNKFAAVEMKREQKIT